MSTEAPAHELTRNPVDGTWGFICREHGVHRAGLAEAHALNVERKHLREDHTEPLAVVEVNLSAAARSFIHYTDPGSASVWRALTGLDYAGSLACARDLAAAQPDVTAAVAPF